jgi:hypothetical protein
MINPRKSSYSGGGGGNCIRVGNGTHDLAVMVQDTKEDETSARTTLTVSAKAWRTFAASLK